MAKASMLDPEERHLLLEALRPPAGYDLSFAIGTTYSLDLLALLTAPLGFTLFELAGPPGADLAPSDAVRLLSVLKKYADRITVFCEAGRIAVPPTHAILFGELEPVVVEVRPPDGYSFHPKIWILRFECEGEPVRYRMLCMTRNLTFDRSWDTMLTLDGELSDRKLAYAVNHPLADFVQALPAMAKSGDLAPRAVANARIAADELRRVRFEPPEGFEDFAFYPLGIEGYHENWPFADIDQLLIISPFLSDSALTDLASEAGKTILISRTDALDSTPRNVLAGVAEVYSFSPDATPTEPQDDETLSTDPMAASGLHAKLYVADRGWNASVLTGSANATRAAWHGNVEFLTELVGKRSRCGVDALLAAEKGQVNLCDFLTEYPLDGAPSESNSEQEAELALLESVRRALGGALWKATIIPTELDTFRVTLAADQIPPLPEDVRVLARPILLPESAGQTLLTDGTHAAAVFHPISFDGLTSFFALDVQLVGKRITETCRFVVNARLVDEPDGRRERRTQYLLRDREQVVRFLLLLLTDAPEEIGNGLGEGEKWNRGEWRRGLGNGDALLEPLLRALDRNPACLDDVASVLEDLRKTAEGRAKLPDGIEAVWAPIWEARQALKATTSQ